MQKLPVIISVNFINFGMTRSDYIKWLLLIQNFVQKWNRGVGASRKIEKKNPFVVARIAFETEHPQT
jgi:hypothetical protein